jgi:hypothetical protein
MAALRTLVDRAGYDLDAATKFVSFGRAKLCVATPGAFRPASHPDEGLLARSLLIDGRRGSWILSCTTVAVAVGSVSDQAMGNATTNDDADHHHVWSQGVRRGCTNVPQ